MSSPTPLPVRPMVAPTFSVRLVESRALTSRVRLLTFERADAQPFHFAAGQWVSLVLPLEDDKGRPLRRSYSLASVPRGQSAFELVVTLVEGGPASSFLHGAAPGLVLEAKGPQGTFLRAPDEAAPSLLVATGTGVAPFRGMLHQAVEAGGSAPLWLLFGVRSEEELLFGAELRALAASHPRVRLEVTLSRPAPGWTGRTGYVQQHVAGLWKELDAHGTPHAWVCGVKRMLMEVRRVLREDLGADRQQVSLESYD